MKQQLKESGKKNKTNADNKKNTILSAPEMLGCSSSCSWNCPILADCCVFGRCFDHWTYFSGQVCSRTFVHEGDATQFPPSFSTFYFFTLFYSRISLSACTIKTLKKRINNYSGTSDRLSKATIRRTEYDYIYTKDVVLAPTTAPVGHVRRVPALPDFPGREMTH